MLSRTTSSSGKVTFSSSSPLGFINWAATFLPRSKLGCAIVESGGTVFRVCSVPSNPITLQSEGTRKPFSRNSIGAIPGILLFRFAKSQNRVRTFLSLMSNRVNYRRILGRILNVLVIISWFVTLCPSRNLGLLKRKL